jgi:dienelactone hydrolase
MVPTAKRALEKLSRRGPHDVLQGDLGIAGTPGLVCCPRRGPALPAIVFGHGWLQPPQRYVGLLRHLASWGIVAAAPETQLGALANHRAFAADLRSTLDLCLQARLGDGEISVDGRKLALAGHAMGGGCAILAAAEDERVRAVVTLAATETLPSALDAAQRIKVPGLHIAGGKDLLAPALSNATPISAAWAGPVLLKTIRKANHLGFTEGRHWSQLLLHGKPQFDTQRWARALTTAFLLRTLVDDDRGQALLSEELPAAV